MKKKEANNFFKELYCEIKTEPSSSKRERRKIMPVYDELTEKGHKEPSKNKDLSKGDQVLPQISINN